MSPSGLESLSLHRERVSRTSLSPASRVCLELLWKWSPTCAAPICRVVTASHREILPGNCAGRRRGLRTRGGSGGARGERGRAGPGARGERERAVPGARGEWERAGPGARGERAHWLRGASKGQ